MKIGTMIKTLRASAGLSQQEFAARVGISASFLSLIEADKREPTIRVLRDIAKGLGLPPGVLVAVLLQSDESTSTPEGRKLEKSINDLARAAQHFVLAERLNSLQDDDVTEDRSQSSANRSASEDQDDDDAPDK